MSLRASNPVILKSLSKIIKKTEGSSSSVSQDLRGQDKFTVNSDKTLKYNPNEEKDEVTDLENAKNENLRKSLLMLS